jgi:hypothetical protein
MNMRYNVEIGEVKSLRWLANMFPYTKNPKDETDKMTNAIHTYCTNGADAIEQLHYKYYTGKLPEVLCYCCRKKVPYTILSREKTDNVRGTDYTYEENFAICNECGEEVMVPGIEDENEEYLMRLVNGEGK